MSARFSRGKTVTVYQGFRAMVNLRNGTWKPTNWKTEAALRTVRPGHTPVNPRRHGALKHASSKAFDLAHR